MCNRYRDSAEGLVYPGIYVPLVRLGSSQGAQDFVRSAKAGIPPVNITEDADCFIVEVFAPGARREDFLVHVQGRNLYISLVPTQDSNIPQKNFKFKEQQTSPAEQHILLPVDAETEFLCAEYRNGILRLLLPKAGNATKALDTLVAVY